MDDIQITDSLSIPLDELTITASRAGGPGGQHVNKANTRVTVRWNVAHSRVLSQEQKDRITQKLGNVLTHDGDIIIHHSASRSQQHNKKMALQQLAIIIRKALHIPKKRTATTPSKGAQQARLQKKAHRSILKKMRKISSHDE